MQVKDYIIKQIKDNGLDIKEGNVYNLNFDFVACYSDKGDLIFSVKKVNVTDKGGLKDILTELKNKDVSNG